MSSNRLEMLADSELPRISIVVIGRNEGERLVRCLESVRVADYPRDKVELIYVDTDSSDGSCVAAEKLGAKVIRIRPERPSAAAARNAGLRAASHELLHFLDGDAILDRGWLKKAVAAFADSEVACVFGRVEELSPTATVYNFWAHHDWHVSPGRTEACGGIAFFRRGALLKAGGYDESLIAGEERDLCVRLTRDQHVAIVCLDEPMALHDINMTRFRQYWRRCVRTGHAYAEIARRHPGVQSWRRARWRNLFYALGTPLSLGLSLGLWVPWPIAAWLAFVVLAVLRNALRLRRRVGTLGGALGYSSHHYLAKTPIALGQCAYWLRSALSRKPQSLIEYRT
ncbi:MAG: glycosyltransferase [Phycisphaerae bacterium]